MPAANHPPFPPCPPPPLEHLWVHSQAESILGAFQSVSFPRSSPTLRPQGQGSGQAAGHMGIQTAGRERKPSLVVNSAGSWSASEERGRESERPEQSLTCSQRHTVTDTRGHNFSDATQKLTWSSQRHVQKTHLQRLMDTQHQTCSTDSGTTHMEQTQPPSCKPQTQMHSKSTNTNAFQIQPAKSFSSIKPLRPPQPRPVHPPLNSNLEFLSHCLSFNEDSLGSMCIPLPSTTWLCALKKCHSQQESP